MQLKTPFANVLIVFMCFPIECNAAAVKAMENQKVVIERDAWFKEAETAEKSSSVATARALVAATMEIGVEEQDRRNTWINDADTVRAVLDSATPFSLEYSRVYRFVLLPRFPHSLTRSSSPL